MVLATISTWRLISSGTSNRSLLVALELITRMAKHVGARNQQRQVFGEIGIFIDDGQAVGATGGSRVPGQFGVSQVSLQNALAIQVRDKAVIVLHAQHQAVLPHGVQVIDLELHSREHGGGAVDDVVGYDLGPNQVGKVVVPLSRPNPSGPVAHAESSKSGAAQRSASVSSDGTKYDAIAPASPDTSALSMEQRYGGAYHLDGSSRRRPSRPGRGAVPRRRSAVGIYPQSWRP